MAFASSWATGLGETSGQLHLCIPYSTLEPLRDILNSNLQGDHGGPDRRWVQLLQSQIQSAEVELVTELAHAPATVEQLLAFKPGDFVELDLPQRIQAKVDGVPVFECQYGTSSGRYAIRVEQTLTTGQHQGWHAEKSDGH